MGLWSYQAATGQTWIEGVKGVDFYSVGATPADTSTSDVNIKSDSFININGQIRADATSSLILDAGDGVLQLAVVSAVLLEAGDITLKGFAKAEGDNRPASATILRGKSNIEIIADHATAPFIDFGAHILTDGDLTITSGTTTLIGELRISVFESLAGRFAASGNIKILGSTPTTGANIAEYGFNIVSGGSITIDGVLATNRSMRVVSSAKDGVIILGANAVTSLSATNDLTIIGAGTPATASTNKITLMAGNDLTLNANINTTGDLDILGNNSIAYATISITARTLLMKQGTATDGDEKIVLCAEKGFTCTLTGFGTVSITSATLTGRLADFLIGTVLNLGENSLTFSRGGSSAVDFGTTLTEITTQSDLVISMGNTSFAFEALTVNVGGDFTLSANGAGGIEINGATTGGFTINVGGDFRINGGEQYHNIAGLFTINVGGEIILAQAVYGEFDVGLGGAADKITDISITATKISRAGTSTSDSFSFTISGGIGSITIDAVIDFNPAFTLTARGADSDITLAKDIKVNGANTLRLTASGGSIEAKGNVESGGNIDFDAGGDITIAGAVMASGNADFDASDDITITGAVTAGGTAGIRGGGALTLNGDLTITGDLDIIATGAGSSIASTTITISANTILARENGAVISCTSRGWTCSVTGGVTTFTISSTVLTGRVADFLSNGVLDFGVNSVRLNIAGNADFGSTMSAISSLGSLTISVGSGFTLGFDELAITAGGDITLGGAITIDVADLVITAGGNIQFWTTGLQFPVLIAQRDVSLTAGGDISVGRSTSITANAGDISFSATLIDANHGLTVVATAGDFTTDSEFEISIGDFTLTTGGDITINNDIATVRAITLTAGRMLTITGDITSRGGVRTTLISTDDMVITGDILAGSLTFTSAAGMTITGDVSSSSGGSTSLTLTSTDAMVITGDISTTATNAARTVRISAGDGSSITGDINNGATGSASVIDIDASGALTITGAITSSRAITIGEPIGTTSTLGALTINGAVVAGAAITVNAGGAVLFTSPITANGDITIATTSDLTLRGDVMAVDGNGDAAGVVTLTSGPDTIFANGITIIGTSVSLTEGTTIMTCSDKGINCGVDGLGTITITSATLPASLTTFITGTVLELGDNSLTLFVNGNIDLSTVITEITTTSDLVIKIFSGARTLSLSSLVLNVGGDLTLAGTISASASFQANVGGNIILDNELGDPNATIAFSLTTVNNLTLDAGGDIVLTGANIALRNTAGVSGGGTTLTAQAIRQTDDETPTSASLSVREDAAGDITINAPTTLDLTLTVRARGGAIVLGGAVNVGGNIQITNRAVGAATVTAPAGSITISGALTGADITISALTISFGGDITGEELRFTTGLTGTDPNEVIGQITSARAGLTFRGESIIMIQGATPNTTGSILVDGTEVTCADIGVTCIMSGFVYNIGGDLINGFTSRLRDLFDTTTGILTIPDGDNPSIVLVITGARTFADSVWNTIIAENGNITIRTTTSASLTFESLTITTPLSLTLEGDITITASTGDITLTLGQSLIATATSGGQHSASLIATAGDIAISSPIVADESSRTLTLTASAGAVSVGGDITAHHLTINAATPSGEEGGIRLPSNARITVATLLMTQGGTRVTCASEGFDCISTISGLVVEFTSGAYTDTRITDFLSGTTLTMGDNPLFLSVPAGSIASAFTIRTIMSDSFINILVANGGRVDIPSGNFTLSAAQGITLAGNLGLQGGGVLSLSGDIIASGALTLSGHNTASLRLGEFHDTSITATSIFTNFNTPTPVEVAYNISITSTTGEVLLRGVGLNTTGNITITSADIIRFGHASSSHSGLILTADRISLSSRDDDIATTEISYADITLTATSALHLDTLLITQTDGATARTVTLTVGSSSGAGSFTTGANAEIIADDFVFTVNGVRARCATYGLPCTLKAREFTFTTATTTTTLDATALDTLFGADPYVSYSGGVIDSGNYDLILTFEANTTFTISAITEILSGGKLTIQNGTSGLNAVLNLSTALTIEAVGDVTIDDITLTATGAVDMTSQAGSFTFSGSPSISGSSVAVRGDGPVVTDANTLTLTATAGDIYIGVGLNQGQVILSATGGDIILAGGSITATGNDHSTTNRSITIIANSDATGAGGAIVFMGEGGYELTAINSIRFESDKAPATPYGYDITFESTSNRIILDGFIHTLGAFSATTSAGSVLMGTNSELNITAGSITISDTATSVLSTDASSNPISLTSTTGGIILRTNFLSSADISIVSATTLDLATTRAFSLQTSGNITIISKVAPSVKGTNQINLSTTGTGIMEISALIDTSGGVVIGVAATGQLRLAKAGKTSISGSSIQIRSRGAISAGEEGVGDVILQAKTGDLDFGGQLKTAGFVELQAVKGSVILGNNTQETIIEGGVWVSLYSALALIEAERSTVDITLTSARLVNVSGYIWAGSGNTITLDAGDGIVQLATDFVTNIEAGEIHIKGYDKLTDDKARVRGLNDITLTSPIVNLESHIVTDGDITIDSGGEMLVDLRIAYGSSIYGKLDSGGDITIRATNVRDVANTPSRPDPDTYETVFGLTIDAVGNIQIDGTIQTQRSIKIRGTGIDSIIILAKSVETDIIAGTTLVFTASDKEVLSANAATMPFSLQSGDGQSLTFSASLRGTHIDILAGGALITTGAAKNKVSITATTLLMREGRGGDNEKGAYCAQKGFACSITGLGRVEVTATDWTTGEGIATRLAEFLIGTVMDLGDNSLTISLSFSEEPLDFGALLTEITTQTDLSIVTSNIIDGTVDRVIGGITVQVPVPLQLGKLKADSLTVNVGGSLALNGALSASAGDLVVNVGGTLSSGGDANDDDWGFSLFSETANVKVDVGGDIVVGSANFQIQANSENVVDARGDVTVTANAIRLASSAAAFTTLTFSISNAQAGDVTINAPITYISADRLITPDMRTGDVDAVPAAPAITIAVASPGGSVTMNGDIRTNGALSLFGTGSVTMNGDIYMTNMMVTRTDADGEVTQHMIAADLFITSAFATIVNGFISNVGEGDVTLTAALVGGAPLPDGAVSNIDISGALIIGSYIRIKGDIVLTASSSISLSDGLRADGDIDIIAGYAIHESPITITANTLLMTQGDGDAQTATYCAVKGFTCVLNLNGLGFVPAVEITDATLTGRLADFLINGVLDLGDNVAELTITGELDFADTITAIRSQTDLTITIDDRVRFDSLAINVGGDFTFSGIFSGVSVREEECEECRSSRLKFENYFDDLGKVALLVVDVGDLSIFVNGDFDLHNGNFMVEGSITTRVIGNMDLNSTLSMISTTGDITLTPSGTIMGEPAEVSDVLQTPALIFTASGGSIFINSAVSFIDGTVNLGAFENIYLAGDLTMTRSDIEDGETVIIDGMNGGFINVSLIAGGHISASGITITATLLLMNEGIADEDADNRRRTHCATEGIRCVLPKLVDFRLYNLDSFTRGDLSRFLIGQTLDLGDNTVSITALAKIDFGGRDVIPAVPAVYTEAVGVEGEPGYVAPIEIRPEIPEFPAVPALVTEIKGRGGVSLLFGTSEGEIVVETSVLVYSRDASDNLIPIRTRTVLIVDVNGNPVFAYYLLDDDIQVPTRIDATPTGTATVTVTPYAVDKDGRPVLDSSGDPVPLMVSDGMGGMMQAADIVYTYNTYSNDDLYLKNADGDFIRSNGRAIPQYQLNQLSTLGVRIGARPVFFQATEEITTYQQEFETRMETITDLVGSFNFDTLTLNMDGPLVIGAPIHTDSEFTINANNDFTIKRTEVEGFDSFSLISGGDFTITASRTINVEDHFTVISDGHLTITAPLLLVDLDDSRRDPLLPHLFTRGAAIFLAARNADTRITLATPIISNDDIEIHAPFITLGRNITGKNIRIISTGIQTAADAGFQPDGTFVVFTPAVIVENSLETVSGIVIRGDYLEMEEATEQVVGTETVDVLDADGNVVIEMMDMVDPVTGEVVLDADGNPVQVPVMDADGNAVAVTQEVDVMGFVGTNVSCASQNITCVLSGRKYTLFGTESFTWERDFVTLFNANSGVITLEGDNHSITIIIVSGQPDLGALQIIAETGSITIDTSNREGNLMGLSVTDLILTAGGEINFIEAAINVRRTVNLTARQVNFISASDLTPTMIRNTGFSGDIVINAPISAQGYLSLITEGSITLGGNINAAQLDVFAGFDLFYGIGFERTNIAIHASTLVLKEGGYIRSCADLGFTCSFSGSYSTTINAGNFDNHRLFELMRLNDGRLELGGTSIEIIVEDDINLGTMLTSITTSGDVIIRSGTNILSVAKLDIQAGGSLEIGSGTIQTFQGDLTLSGHQVKLARFGTTELLSAGDVAITSAMGLPIDDIGFFNVMVETLDKDNGLFTLRGDIFTTRAVIVDVGELVIPSISRIKSRAVEFIINNMDKFCRDFDNVICR